ITPARWATTGSCPQPRDGTADDRARCGGTTAQQRLAGIQQPGRDGDGEPPAVVPTEEDHAATAGMEGRGQRLTSEVPRGAGSAAAGVVNGEFPDDGGGDAQPRGPYREVGLLEEQEELLGEPVEVAPGLPGDHEGVTRRVDQLAASSGTI